MSTEPVRVRSGMVAAQVPVLITATQVFAKDTTQGVVTGSGGDGVRFRELRNLDAANPIFIGPDNTVTSSTGHEIPPGGTFELVSGSGGGYVGDVYAIATGGTVNVSTLQW